MKLALLVLTLGGCVATATTGPTTPAGTPAPATASSGGTTIELAEPIAHGQTVEGIVVLNGSRYYRIDLQAQEALELGFYARTPDKFPYANVAVLDLNGGRLAEQGIAVNSATDWDTNNLAFVAKQAGTYIVRANCTNCEGDTVTYKIVVK